MKLSYIFNMRMPTERAHGIQVVKMCEAFARSGLEVELLASARPNMIKEDPFSYYQAEKNFKIKKLIGLKPQFFYRTKAGFLLQNALFLISARLDRIFSKPGLVYTREQFFGVIFRGYFLEVHNLPKKVRYFHRLTWKRAKKIFVLTKYLKEEIISQGIDENKIIVLPDAVDLEKFDLPITKEDARTKLGLPLNKKIALYSGSFYAYDWKGADILAEAAKYLPDVLVVLVGGGECAGKKHELIVESQNVMLAGRQPYKLIPYYLKAADVLVLPNKAGRAISDKYTSPLKLFEYMAARRPIVASDLPSIREVLNEGNSLLVKPGSSDELAAGIKKVLSDIELESRIAAQSYEDVKPRTWRARAVKILDSLA